MIQFSDTSAANSANLYRFQVDKYPQYDILRVYENHGRKAREKKTKTLYDEKGYAWVANIQTGEIIRQKHAFEIKRCVDTSIIRAKKVLREILMANSWDYFLTLTFNNITQDRTDNKQVVAQWKKFRRNIRAKFPHMRYAAVTEEHKDGCLHFHLVVGGVTDKELRLIDSGHTDKTGRTIYNCRAWPYGLTTATKVDDSEGVSGYLLKYIGKSTGVSDDFKKRYWCSRNCNRPKKQFVDIISDIKLNVFNLFDSIVRRTLTMSVEFWKPSKNYLAIKDNAPSFRFMDYLFKHRLPNLECHYKYTAAGRSYFWKAVKFNTPAYNPF